jgi:hypothetical protein
MTGTEKIQYNLSLLADAFQIERGTECAELNTWTSARFDLTEFENYLVDDLYPKMLEDGNYWNEEELKIKFVAFVFYLANIEVKNQVKTFFERPLSATIDGHKISVVCNCMVATSLKFNMPKTPYFFFQEYKKGKGEFKDPEAQMLSAMIIAQSKNEDNKPIYGGYNIGANWYFSTLIGKTYCCSHAFDATIRENILKIIFTVRQLKTLILNR